VAFSVREAIFLSRSDGHAARALVTARGRSSIAWTNQGSILGEVANLFRVQAAIGGPCVQEPVERFSRTRRGKVFRVRANFRCVTTERRQWSVCGSSEAGIALLRAALFSGTLLADGQSLAGSGLSFGLPVRCCTRPVEFLEKSIWVSLGPRSRWSFSERAGVLFGESWEIYVQATMPMRGTLRMFSRLERTGGFAGQMCRATRQARWALHFDVTVHCGHFAGLMAYCHR